jgi:Protein of unknown function (DUF3606)
VSLAGNGTGEARVTNNKFPKEAPPVNDQINIHDPGEMRVWIRAFGISKEQLEAAVLAAGTDAVKVRLHLSKQTPVPQSILLS